MDFAVRTRGGVATVGLLILVARHSAAAPAAAVFDINSQQSQLTIGAAALGFSDTDTNNIDGTVDVTFDFGGDGFGSPAELTVTGADVTPSGPYTLILGFPPLFGARIVASNLVADVTTPTPPATMTRLGGSAVTYQFAASQFLFTLDQGMVVVTGSANETFDLSENPVSGAPTTGNGTFTFAAGATSGPYTRLDGTLNFPVSVSDTVVLDDGTEVDVTLTGVIVANSSFYAALDGVPGDFNDDGQVNAADLAIWESGYGTAAGANVDDGDANGDDAVDGADFLIWQRNVGIAPPPLAASAVTAIPEPATAALGTLAAALVALACRGVSARKRHGERGA